MNPNIRIRPYKTGITLNPFSRPCFIRFIKIHSLFNFNHSKPTSFEIWDQYWNFATVFQKYRKTQSLLKFSSYFCPFCKLISKVNILCSMINCDISFICLFHYMALLLHILLFFHIHKISFWKTERMKQDFKPYFIWLLKLNV